MPTLSPGTGQAAPSWESGRKVHELYSQTDWVSTPVLPPCSYVTLDTTEEIVWKQMSEGLQEFAYHLPYFSNFYKLQSTQKDFM